MKRYWKLISLTVAIVLVIGGFYIQTALATKSYPSLVIDAEKGNKDELKGVAIEGIYYDQGYVDGEIVKITADGSEYYSDRSFIEYLFGHFNSQEIKRLQENYRNFMRGKWTSLSSFYENDEFLVYADVLSDNFGYMEAGKFAFDIDILNKNSKKRTAFEIDVPNKEGLYYMSVEDVQVVGEVLKVATINQGNGKLEAHVYSFNTQTGKLIEDEVLLSEEEHLNVNRSTEIYMLNPYHHIGDNDYFVFNVLETKQIESESDPYSYEEEAINNYFVSYNVETAERKNFEVEEINVDSYPIAPSQETSHVSGSTVYFSTITEKGVEIYPYSLKDSQLGEPRAVKAESKDESFTLVKMNNDRLYMSGRSDNKDIDASVIVADLNTGNILYEGTIKSEDKELLDYEFYINDIIFE